MHKIYVREQIMKWYEGRIETAGEKTDIIAARLLAFGIEGVEIVDEYENMRFIEEHPSNWDYVEDGLLNATAQKGIAVVKFYLPEDAKADMPSIREALANFGHTGFTLIEDDWSDAWRAHYKPFGLGKNIVIAPVWEDYSSVGGEIVFKIDPGHVFGTGQHQSTGLCVAALEEHVFPGAAVLDIGCGSGILAIISLLLGAETAVAIDIDPSAAKVCLENARLNNICLDRFKIHTGNILADRALLNEISRRKYNIIAANIIADVIIPLAPIAKELLARGGVFIAGGIIKDRKDDVLGALAKAGFKIIKVAVQDEWIAVVATYEA
jgi:ribosomal protein L11 methyltransferase